MVKNHWTGLAAGVERPWYRQQRRQRPGGLGRISPSSRWLCSRYRRGLAPWGLERLWSQGPFSRTRTVLGLLSSGFSVQRRRRVRDHVHLPGLCRTRGRERPRASGASDPRRPGCPSRQRPEGKGCWGHLHGGWASPRRLGPRCPSAVYKILFSGPRCPGEK